MPHPERRLKIRAMVLKAIESRLEDFRDEMYDGAIMGYHLEHVGSLINVKLDPEAPGASLATDIRQWYREKDSPLTVRPSRHGVRLDTLELDDLKLLMPEIEEAWAAFKAIEKPCYQVHTPAAKLQCEICWPNGLSPHGVKC